MTRWWFLLRRYAGQLWVRAALFSLGGLLAALVGVVAAPLVPDALARTVGGEAVDQILTVMASSMLAVATFSLTTLVTAYTAISTSATPRAAALLVSDGRGQSALSAFVGAFLFSVVGLIALSTEYYEAQGRAILFFVSVVVLAAVVLALLRWIDELSRIGRVDEAIDRVEQATLKALLAPLSTGPERSEDAFTPPQGAHSVRAGEVGHVQNVDVHALRAAIERYGVEIHLDRLPGGFVHDETVVAWISAGASADVEHLQAVVRKAYVIGESRTFEQDPRFGLSVLGEIAARALSPGVNDPGTALDVLSTSVRVLTCWARPQTGREVDALPPGLHLRPLTAEDVLDDLFTPIASYGAGDLSVAIRLQKMLAALAALGQPNIAAAARRLSATALARAEAALSLEQDRARVRAAARAISEA